MVPSPPFINGNNFKEERVAQPRVFTGIPPGSAVLISDIGVIIEDLGERFKVKTFHLGELLIREEYLSLYDETQKQSDDEPNTTVEFLKETRKSLGLRKPRRRDYVPGKGVSVGIPGICLGS